MQVTAQFIANLILALVPIVAKFFNMDVDEVRAELVKNAKVDGTASDAVAAKIDSALPGG